MISILWDIKKCSKDAAGSQRQLQILGYKTRGRGGSERWGLGVRKDRRDIGSRKWGTLVVVGVVLGRCKHEMIIDNTINHNTSIIGKNTNISNKPSKTLCLGITSHIP